MFRKEVLFEIEFDALWLRLIPVRFPIDPPFISSVFEDFLESSASVALITDSLEEAVSKLDSDKIEPVGFFLNILFSVEYLFFDNLIGRRMDLLGR